MENDLTLSTLPKTWILDLDGTLLKHNGYKLDGIDSLLPKVKDFMKTIPEDDRVIILTSRTDEYREMTLKFLEEHNIRFDQILFNMPTGERVVINDRKPSGIDMAIAVNVDRNEFDMPNIVRVL